MVAKEAHTSSSVKDLIVAAPRVNDMEWEGTYMKPTGGILTVPSELGGTIHKVAMRGVKLWKEFDESIFKLPKDWKLSRNFSKPWLGWKKDRTVAGYLSDMMYEEVVLRMIRLVFVTHEER